MNILILANSDVGLFKFRKELIDKLKESNDIIIGCPNGEFLDYFEEKGCKLIDTPMNRRGKKPLEEWKLIKQYQDIIKKEKVDLTITYTIKPNIYAGIICRINKIPYAANITGLGTVFQKKDLLRFIVKNLYKISLKKAIKVFFENEENRKLFVDDKIVSYENTYLNMGAGVNLKEFSLLEYPKDESYRLLFIGRIMKEKGIDQLLLAVRKIVIEDGIDCHLHILGDMEEDYLDKFEIYNKEGWLVYHGFQKNIKEFIRECHCFVLPSWHEGMANGNLECAASGRPIITSNVSGCKEAVENEINGYICEPKDVDSLYEALKRLLLLPDQQKKQMGIESRARMKLLFDREIVVNNTLNQLIQRS